MISFAQPVPLKDAVESVSRRTPLGLALGSKEIERLPVQIRQRAFFSAKVEETRLLAQFQREVTRRLRLERRTLADGSQGTYQRRDQFLREMQELAERYGVRPTDERRGSIEDIGSYRRLRLVWDTQIKMAHGYAKWKTQQSKVALDRAPAQELVRISARRMPRLWLEIWADAIADLGTATTAIVKDGRMYALKNDPIWAFISRFNQPWPPFDFNSGMGVRNVRRRKAERLGLVKPGESVEPVDSDFNDGLQASVAGIRTKGRQQLKDYFGDMAEIDEERNVIKWRGGRLDAMVERAERRVAGESFDKKLKAVSFGKVDKALADRARDVMEIDDYELKPMEDDFFHILKGHSESTEQHPDQRPITVDDFYYLLTKWRQPVGIEAGEKPRSIKMTYNFLGDLIAVVWNRDPNQKRFNLNTMYAKK